MNKTCPNCCGELKPEGFGFKCLCCGTKFASEEELRPKRSQSQPTQPTQAAEVVGTQQFDCGSDVFESNINSVLEIAWTDENYLHSGSGFLINSDGYALTNTHVVTHENGKSCLRVNVRICGENTTADVIKLGDNQHGDGNGVDLALIKLTRVPYNATVVQFENFDYVRNGERVFVIGNSLGYGTCITAGIVSDRLRDVNGKMLLMTDCAINGGNSGGPVFNEKGRVIAVVVSGISSAEGMNFAIPSRTVEDFLQGIPNIHPMQHIPDQENPYERLTPYAGEYKGKPEPPPPPLKPALAPCPDCGSDNTNVQNGIFYCEDCGLGG